MSNYLLNYFNWIEISNLNSNLFFLDSVISWEDSSSVLSTDVLAPFGFLLTSFSKIFFSLNFETETSLLDLIITLHYRSSGFGILNSFFLDIITELTSLDTYANYMFVTRNSDLLLNMYTYNPETSLLYAPYVTTLGTYSLETVSSLYDSFLFNHSNTWLDFLIFNTWLLTSVLFISLLLTTTTFSKVNSPLSGNFFFTKFFIFANNFAFENRLQLDWVLLFLFFVVTIWVPVLMTYDDVNVEVVELTHNFICTYFVFIIGYLLYKYSIHYFSFLENSVSDGYTTQYILKQLVRDVSNTFALFLRFFLLLFRLNIYDGLDDFLDSYYIFFIDFDEDSYTDEIFFLADFFTYFSDNREDVIFYQPVEFDWWVDLYSKYFIVFGKLFFFWVFILEEAFRISLALYISYLIIFEVHAVNVSNNEDSYMFFKKTGLKG